MIGADLPSALITSLGAPHAVSAADLVDVAELGDGRIRIGWDDHVLEIGTGWGSFAVHAARHYGCRVTTTTVSAAQARYAAAQVRRLGLEDRVTVLQQDYRELNGTYDKLVSLEMIEAVSRLTDSAISDAEQILEAD